MKQLEDPGWERVVGEEIVATQDRQEVCVKKLLEQVCVQFVGTLTLGAH